MSQLAYTIGHSTHPVEKFLDLLNRHKITALADVRSTPYSRLNPQFNRESIKSCLKKAGVEYVFLGHQLGARSEDRTCYVDGRVQYDLLAHTTEFQHGIDRVIEGARTYRVALMCAEKDPLTCHRTILVCRSLVARGFDALHILEDGQIESHDSALKRLLLEVDLKNAELFRSREQLIAEAYALRGREIAYVQRPNFIPAPQRKVAR